mmetsp:Transcript_56488/g.165159  ORF Transcript_56488/g.165159 Transcript_56488/m.165159 type:complete len:324 (+) Transcript_56488:668-1639(+)
MHRTVVLQPTPGVLVAMREATGEAEVQRGRQLQFAHVASRLAPAEVRLGEEGEVALNVHPAKGDVFPKEQIAVVPELQRALELLELLAVGDRDLDRGALRAVHEDAAGEAGARQGPAVAAEGDARDRVLVADAPLAARELGGPRRPPRPGVPLVPPAVPAPGEEQGPGRQEDGGQRPARPGVVAHAHEEPPRAEVEDARLAVGAARGQEPRAVVEEAPDRALQRPRRARPGLRAAAFEGPVDEPPDRHRAQGPETLRGARVQAPVLRLWGPLRRRGAAPSGVCSCTLGLRRLRLLGIVLAGHAGALRGVRIPGVVCSRRWLSR